MTAPRLSLVVIARNERRRLPGCLRSAQGVAGEIVLVDDHSDDDTVAVARHTAAALPGAPELRVFSRRYDTPARQMNFGMDQARGEWILLLDADERLSPALREAVLRHCDAPARIAGFYCPRRNFVFGRWLRHGRNYPDYNHARLVRRGRARFTDHPVHPKLRLDGDAAYLTAPLLHLSYADLDAYFAKFNRYTTGEAVAMAAAGRRYSFGRMGIESCGNLWRRAILGAAFLDGAPGLIYVALGFLYDLVRHAKLRELNRHIPAPPPSPRTTHHPPLTTHHPPPMRIGLDLQSTHGPVSGIGAYAEGLAAALSALGGAHTYVPLWYRGFTRWPAPAEMARAQLALAGAGWRRRLDLIHAPGFAPPLWGRARRILTLHDISVVQRPDLLPSGPSRLYWRDWMAFAARRADCLVAPSRFTADSLRACLGVPAARIRHLPYPPRALFRPAPPERQAELRRRFDLPRPYLLGVGATEPRKDWRAVVRAFARLRDRPPGHAGLAGYDLVLAGGANVAASAASLTAEIARCGLDARVRRLGYVPTDWMPALYSAAEVFVFPETFAGYGLPVLEAMACGTPVVTFDNTALPETAAGAALLIPPPYHPAAIAEALSTLLASPAHRAELRRRGLARVAQLDWERTARAMVAIYEEFGPCR